MTKLFTHWLCWFRHDWRIIDIDKYSCLLRCDRCGKYESEPT